MSENLSKRNNGFLFFIRKLEISLIILIIFSIGFIPFTIFFYIIYHFFQNFQFLIFILFPIIIYFGIVILIISQLTISGFFIKIFKIKYKTGIYNYNYLDKN